MAPIVVPAAQPPEQLTERVTVSMTAAEKLRLQRAAARAGLSMSAYVRRLIQAGT